MTTSVALEDADPGSLLNLYRRLIHLRRQSEALATGTLVALAANNPHVAAYLRRSGTHAALVVANLGATPAAGVSIGSGRVALPPGSYKPNNLLGGRSAAPLSVGRDGRIKDYVPAATIGSRESLVLDLIRR